MIENHFSFNECQFSNCKVNFQTLLKSQLKYLYKVDLFKSEFRLKLTLFKIFNLTFMKLFLSTILLIGLSAYSQVGVNTTNPQATLDVREANPAAPTNGAGIAIPQINILPATGNRSGQLVLLTTDNSYYYYNGTVWIPLCPRGIIGDIKYGLQTIDHSGWIKLDGRPIATLTANQITAANSLGLITNLPNAANAFLVNNGTALGSVTGSNTKTITQANLPAVNFTGTTNTTGNHTHAHNAPGTAGNNGLIIRSIAGQATTTLGTDAIGSGIEPDLNATPTALTITTAGNHTHTVTVASGGAGTPINITPQSLSANTFIYLGN